MYKQLTILALLVSLKLQAMKLELTLVDSIEEWVPKLLILDFSKEDGPQSSEEFIENFNKSDLDERELKVTKGIIFNDAKTGLMYPIFRGMRPEKLNETLKKLTIPDCSD